MKQIHIDLETYCDRELSECGVYRYAEDLSFEILLFAYAVDDGPVHVVDCASGEQVPTDILAALTDDTIQKWAHNAAFDVSASAVFWACRKADTLIRRPGGAVWSGRLLWVFPLRWRTLG